MSSDKTFLLCTVQCKLYNAPTEMSMLNVAIVQFTADRWRCYENNILLLFSHSIKFKEGFKFKSIILPYIKDDILQQVENFNIIVCSKLKFVLEHNDLPSN